MSRVTTCAAAFVLMASSVLAQVSAPTDQRGHVPAPEGSSIEILNVSAEEDIPLIRLADGEYTTALPRGEVAEIAIVTLCEDLPPPALCPATSYDFGTVATGAPGPYHTPTLLGPHSVNSLRVVNLSEEVPATNLSIEIEGPFEWAPPPIPGACRGLVTLWPGVTCDVRVRFVPTEPGPAEGLLTIFSQEGAEATVTLYGTGGDDVLLYGQFHDWSTLPSHQFVRVRNARHTTTPTFDSEFSDDFVVEGPDEWTIKVIGMGYDDMSISARRPLFDVYIVLDDNGYPGEDVVCEAPGSEILWHDRAIERHTDIALSAPCTLGPGHYWLRVRPLVIDGVFEPTFWTTQFFPAEPPGGMPIHLNPPAWRNPGEGINSNCLDWTYIHPAACGNATSPSNAPFIYGAVFWLVGESGSSGGHTIAYDDEGGAGWRMLSSPMSGATVADLAASNLVRGLDDEYPDGDLNLYLGYSGNNDTEDPHRGFTPATARADALEPGRGFIWYLFDENFNPPESSGTSQSYAMPFNLTFSGSPVVENHEITFTEDDRSSMTDDGFYLIGNPYTAPYNVRGIVPSNGGYSMTYHHWDAAADKGGAYTLLSGLDDAEADVATGFFMQFGHLPTLPVTITFGPPVSGPPEPPNGTLTRLTADFELTGELVYGENETVEVGDGNARMIFAEDATDGFDLYDAGKLTPLSYYWANIALMGMQGDDLVRRSIESRPLPLAAVTIPMAFSTYASGLDAGGEFTISLSDNDLGAGWQVHLTDLDTGETVNMLTDSHTFTIEAQPAIDADERFELTFTPPTVSGEGSGEGYVFGLEAVWPNPTSSTTQVAFTLQTADEITIDVFDVLGRRVAQVANGEYAAGRHVLPMHTTQLASGVYVVRLTAGSQTAVQRVTVAR